MNGAIVINKPKGMTSRDVVNRLNRLLATKEIGHIGTLDPMATGVLVCLVGRATKLSEILMNHEKEYIATFKLGVLTDTLDVTGQVLKEEKVNVNKSVLIHTLNNFVGTYEQEVPIYSAIKVAGKKLYDYARNNEAVVLPKKTVTIEYIKLLKIKGDIVTIKTKVSKGTYIRSLVRDIGVSLGTHGTLTALERTSLGNFSLKEATSLEAVSENNYHLFSIEEILKNYPHEEVDAALLFKISNGQKLPKKIKDYLLFTAAGQAIALYQKDDQALGHIKLAVMFYIK